MNIDPALPVLSGWDAALAFQSVALFALLAIGVVSLKRRPWIGFGLCWFFVHLAPTNSVVPRLDVASERHLYLALWGVALAVSVQLATLGWPKRVVRSTATAVLAGLAVFSISRQLDYRSETALWEAAVREAPWNARAHNNLGYARALAGDHAGAVRDYRQALAFSPGDARARYNLERSLAALRR
jgi:hypothetical protein